MFFRDALRTTAYACLIGALYLFAPSDGVAQEVTEGQDRTSFDALSGFELNPLQGMAGVSRFNEMVPMEGAVDEAEFIVGPGDLFGVAVGGPQPVRSTVPVSADGYLLLPEAGAVEVAGETLAEARRRARLALIDEFENVRVDVTLSQPRRFYVHVSGAIPVPGRYLATPVARVATVLSRAYSDSTRPPVSNLDLRPALRNVKLIHSNGSSERVDLLKYFSTGNTAYNPYLRDGDVISVPTYDPAYEAVYISGDLPFPGTYDHRPDDTLSDLLELGTGETLPGGFELVRVLRAGDDGNGQPEVYSVDKLDRSIKISARDQVHAIQDSTVRGSASIEGWVRYPGTFPILPGRTTLEELLGKAGGLRQGALERAAYLQRASLPMPEPQIDSGNRFELGKLSLPGVRMVRADTLAILQDIRLAQLDYLSRAYLAHELRLQNRVPIDLSTLGSEAPIRLEDGDRIFVPRDENSVFVVGQVNRPGYVTYEPNAGLDYYIAASGGFAENAGAAYLIEAGTGRYLDVGSAPIESGDKIFVNRDIMRADSERLQQLLAQERRADLDERSRTVSNIVQSISAATAIVTTYLLIRREFN